MAQAACVDATDVCACTLFVRETAGIDPQIHDVYFINMHARKCIHAAAALRTGG